MKKLPLIVLALLALAGAAVAGTISDGLKAQMTGMDGNDEIKVLVVLQDQADIASLDWSLHTTRAPMAQRHREVIDTLREVADRSQGPLLAELSARARGGAVRGFTPHWLVNAIVVVTTVDGVRDLAARNDVETIEANLEVELIEPVEEDRPDGDGLARAIGTTPGVIAVRAPEVWNILGVDGTGALVGNMDTGVDGDHPALSARWRGNWHPASECWHDAIGYGDPTPEDHHYHGTHVMGTITGLAPGDTIGVAPGALWIADNTIDQGAGSAFDNDVLAGLEWFSDPDLNSLTLDDVPDVVQHSWGVHEGFSGYFDCDSRWWTAIDNCEAAGVVNTWSAGNEGPGSGSLRSPGDRALTATNCFSVGSTVTSPPYTISSFSSRGPSGCGGAFATKPEVCAPGSNIYSAQPGGGYQYLSGTSMAGPHVAGVVALMRAANPNLDVITVKQILMDTAVDLGSAGNDNTYGEGFIDAYEAVLAAMTGYGTIEGYVTDAETLAPIDGALVDIVGDARSTTTDATGFFSIMLPESAWTVEYSAYLYDSESINRVVVADAVTDGNMALNQSPLADIQVNPSTLTETLAPGAQSAQIVTVTNAGDAQLDFSTAVQLSTGDAYGYSWTDSDAAGGPAYNWVEISGVGQSHSLNDDALTGSLALGFPFTFYGNSFTDVRVCSNGFLTFTSNVFPPTNLSIPNAANPNNVVAVFWDDLNPYLGGNIYTYADAANSRFIVQWDAVPLLSGGAIQTFQVILNADGTIINQYESVSNAGFCTVGIENGTGDTGLEVTHNWPYLHDGLAVLISQPDPWVLASPLSASVSPSNSSDVIVSYDAADLSVGTYNATLRLFSNDPFDPVIVVPITLDVTGATGVNVVGLPSELSLGRPYPNPFGASSSIAYDVPTGGAQVDVSIFDVTGRRVKTLVSEARPAGRHIAVWRGVDSSGQRVASGTYFYRMRAGDFEATRRIVRVR